MSCDNFKDKLLVCDMDGTLLNSRSLISRENKEAIYRFVENGGLFTVATGRDEETLRPYISELPINLPVILYNGAVIYDYASERVLWSDPLPGSVKSIVEEIMTAFDEVGVEIFQGSRIHVLRESESINRHIKRDNFVPVISSIDSVELPWLKVIFGWEPDDLKDVDTYIENMRLPFRHMYSQPDFIEILNINVSKGNALHHFTKLSNTSERHIVAMGDNMNDLEMLQVAATGIAVSNANESLKSLVNLCCCHHDEHAVLEVIQWIEEGKVI